MRPPLFAIDLDHDLIRTAYASPDGSVHEGPSALPGQSLDALLETAREQMGFDFREIVLAIPVDSPRPRTPLTAGYVPDSVSLASRATLRPDWLGHIPTQFTVVRHMFRPILALEACPGLGPSVVVVEAHSQGWTQTRWLENDGIWDPHTSSQPPDHILVVGGPVCSTTAEHLKKFTVPIHFPDRPEWTVVHGAALFALRLCGISDA